MKYVLVELGHAIRINGELAISHIRLSGTLYKATLPELIDVQSHLTNYPGCINMTDMDTAKEEES